jgi:hypothetical protein
MAVAILSPRTVAETVPSGSRSRASGAFKTRSPRIAFRAPSYRPAGFGDDENHAPPVAGFMNEQWARRVTPAR